MPFSVRWKSKSKPASAPLPFPFGQAMPLDGAYSRDYGQSYFVHGPGYQGYLVPTQPKVLLPPLSPWTGLSRLISLPTDPQLLFPATVPPVIPPPLPLITDPAMNGAFSTRSAAQPLPPVTGSAPNSNNSSIIPLPPTTSVIATIQHELTPDPNTRRPGALQWDTTHVYTNARVHGQQVSDAFLNQPLFTYDPHYAVTQVQVKVEHISGSHYGKFVVTPRGPHVTVRDVLEGIQGAFRTPLTADEVAEYVARGQYLTLASTVVERSRDPHAAGTPAQPIKVDVLNSGRFFHGLQVARFSASHRRYVLKLIVGPAA